MDIQIFSNLISKYVKEGSVPTTFEGSAKLFDNEVVKKFLPAGDITALLKTFDDILAVISLEDAKKRDGQLHKLNKDLLTKTFIFADTLSALDLAYYVILYNWMSKLNDKERFVFCNITRWFNLVQNQTPIVNVQPLVVISTTPPPPEKKEEKKPAAGAATATASADKKEENKKEKKPQQPKVVEPPKPEDISRFEIRVGKIVECKKHENADSLYVEKIDLGEAAPRQIVSGLVKFIPLETMIGHRVLVLCNLKPSNLKSVRSEGMVLCASNDDHTQVEFVEPPADAKIGERVMFDQYPGEFDKVLKKETVDAVLGCLSSNADKVATYKGDPFKTSAGSCFCKTISNGPIK
ncbi:hypothetical protein CYY_003518 [Polysphondylium violaceum]|uniref:tRNA-binding domain-containing protein n=1 Tax=Polysphondylium violaceum TaxID=133409 RepID=A0A8J4PXK3_9MYCE|nr:hypothetical protein CYY_003518 [Polysphondylium violaceum]